MQIWLIVFSIILKRLPLEDVRRNDSWPMPAIFNPDDVGRCGASTLRRPSVYACVEGVGHETQSENKRSVVDPVFCFPLPLVSTFVFLAGEIPFFQKALFRNGVALLIAGSSMVVSKRTLSVPPPCRLALVSRVLCGSVSVFCNFYAIDRLLLASSNSLNKLAPFFAIVLAACFLGERLGGGRRCAWRWRLREVCS